MSMMREGLSKALTDGALFVDLIVWLTGRKEYRSQSDILDWLFCIVSAGMVMLELSCELNQIKIGGVQV